MASWKLQHKLPMLNDSWLLSTQPLFLEVGKTDMFHVGPGGSPSAVNTTLDRVASTLEAATKINLRAH